MKHLLYEHQNNISELKAEGAVSLKLAQDEHRGGELELRKDKRALKVSLKEQELSHEDLIKNLKRVRLFSNIKCVCVFQLREFCVIYCNLEKKNGMFNYVQPESFSVH